jgi:hypothetical protein
MITSMPNKQNKNNKKRQRQLQHHPKNTQIQRHKLKFVLLKIIVVGGFTLYVINSFYLLFQHHQQQQQQLSQHQHSRQQQQPQHPPQQLLLPQQQQPSKNKNDRPLLLSSSSSSLSSKSSLSSNLINKTMTTMTTMSTSTTSIKETNNKNETNTKNSDVLYFRYDQVGPQIVEKGIGSIGSSSIAPKTHFLSSIPKKYRLLTSDLLLGGGSLDVGLSSKLLDGSSNGSLESEKKKNHHQLLLEDYSSQKKNVWPQKLHLFEMNPSIAKLPNKYRQDPTWQTYFNNLNNNNKGNNGSNGGSAANNTQMQQMSHMPVYVSVYRITHWNNCYDGTINVKMYGGSWKNVGLGKSKTSSNVSIIPQTDYLGLALLDSNLNIVMDITVTLQTLSTVII